MSQPVSAAKFNAAGARPTLAISICYWLNYTKGQIKLSSKSENAMDSDRVLKFVYDMEWEHTEAAVQCSMRHVSYQVTIRTCVTIKRL